ncbi:hypothetical protein L9F63_001223, partial [Diploptera punctata]
IKSFRSFSCIQMTRSLISELNSIQEHSIAEPLETGNKKIKMASISSNVSVNAPSHGLPNAL